MLTQAQAQNAFEKDINVTTPEELPTDTVSGISWSPHGPNPSFAASSWDSHIRIYDLDVDSKSLKQNACFDAESPCLSVNWHTDMPRLFTGCTDGSLKFFDVETGDSTIAGYHEGPVKSVYWISQVNALLTLSFDQTLRFWDPRQESKHLAGFQLGHKAMCSDLIFPHLAIGLSQGKALLLNLNDIQRVMDTRNGERSPYIESPLGPKTQLASIKLNSYPAEMRIGFGGNDGRCNISTLPDPNYSLTRLEPMITFKGHKVPVPGSNKETLYPVNCLGFHPRMKDFLYTAGGEGKMYFWDLGVKNKIAEFDFRGIPITQAEMDPTRTYLAYSLGSDWARGIQSHMTQPSKICVHTMQAKELKWDSHEGYPLKY